jgi:hypothetical protein
MEKKEQTEEKNREIKTENGKVYRRAGCEGHQINLFYLDLSRRARRAGYTFLSSGGDEDEKDRLHPRSLFQNHSQLSPPLLKQLSDIIEQININNKFLQIRVNAHTNR